MSELTRCNFCTLMDMRRRAQVRRTRVVMRLEPSGPMRGWTSARYANEDKPQHYFLELTDHCVC
jgi:hypothetical protein